MSWLWFLRPKEKPNANTLHQAPYTKHFCYWMWGEAAFSLSFCILYMFKPRMLNPNLGQDAIGRGTANWSTSSYSEPDYDIGGKPTWTCRGPLWSDFGPFQSANRTKATPDDKHLTETWNFQDPILQKCGVKFSTKSSESSFWCDQFLAAQSSGKNKLHKFRPNFHPPIWVPALWNCLCEDLSLWPGERQGWGESRAPCPRVLGGV